MRYFPNLLPPSSRLLLWGIALLGSISLHCPPAVTQSPAENPATDSPSEKRLTRGHAHNDYLHERPLLEALELGFASIEADIFLREGQLLIGHTQADLRPERTLEGMYLAPLAERLGKQNGSGPASDRPLILLIDIKTEAGSTWESLHPLLLKYREILSETVDGKFRPRAVTVIISGNRATERILATRPRLAGVDGRLSDLESSLRPDEMPLLSDAWAKHFQWRGRGPMPDAEAKKLRDLVARAHSTGRMVRFWATPETAPLWRELQTAEVDLIGTEQLERVAEFLRQSADKK
ncbi:MAG: phosphatidylinositol-specific phospholipase C/glycerophosphodiester phosphodiesterase family protein [Planctomycetota bacterium]